MSRILVAIHLYLQQCLFTRYRHQHIKPSASIIAKVHILKADIFTLGLQLLLCTKRFYVKWVAAYAYFPHNCAIFFINWARYAAAGLHGLRCTSFS
ncbi:hypothetical protein E0H84_15045 [Acinetobacter terrestris]|nr:hypothetical protein E0H84_15045 [Acinetobacter terrestris]